MKLQEYLEEAGVSISRFAEKVGISRQLVHKWLRGKEPLLRYALIVEDLTDGKVDCRSWGKPSEEQNL